MAEWADYRHHQSRPALTPLLGCGALFWLGCALGYGNAPGIQGDQSLLCVAILGGAALAVFALVLFKRKMVLFLAAFGLLGATLGIGMVIFLQVQAASVLQGLQNDVILTLMEDSSNTGFGENAVAMAQMPSGEVVKVSARLKEGQPWYFGQSLRCAGTFHPVDLASSDYALRKGYALTFNADTADPCAGNLLLDGMAAFRKKVIEAVGEQTTGNAVLQALVCGFRRNVSSADFYSAYQNCGLAHLIAVSGAHLVIVTGLFAALLGRVACPRPLAIFVLITIMVAYLVLSGAPISALRATVMSSVGVLSLFGHRRPSSLNALGLGIVVIVASSPSTSLSVSFTLSALSTGGIVVFSPLLQEWLRQTPLDRFPFAVDALSLTFASNLLSQLYACSIFSLLPLISPLANLVCAPLFPLVCTAGLVAGMAAGLQLPGAGLLVSLAAQLAQFMNAVVEFMAEMPFASVPFTCPTAMALAVSLVAALGLWVLWPPFKKAIPWMGCALALLVTVCLFPRQGDRVVMLDVGQGDALLVQSQGRTLLVDTGNKDSLLLKGLASRHIASLDAVAITHGDDDHCGSLDVLERSVAVGQVLLAKDTVRCSGENAQDLVAQARCCSDRVTLLGKGDVINVGAFEIKVLWPEHFTDEGGNGDSLCLWLDYDGDDDGKVDFTALLTGDAEQGQLQTLIDQGEVGKVDILKVGHHGSKNALTTEVIQALRPSVALIGVGKNNRYGHPHDTTLELLESVGCQVFRTDQDGEVACTLEPRRLAVDKTA